MKENKFDTVKNAGNKNSIEEDIKIALDKFSDNKDIDSAILIVEKFILGNYILRGGRKNIVKDSLRYILSDYKRVLEEANRYKNMYKAEHEIHLVRNEQLNRKENAITRCKELENENKTIKEANNYWRSRYCEISNNSIPIQKVKNKIEEIVEKIKYEENEKVVIYLHKQKNILQELLESEE